MVQILIIIFLDSICKFKIPGMFIVTSSKTEYMYMKVFKSVYNIMTQKLMCILKVKYIIIDREISLIKGINNIFKKYKRICSYFHLKYDIKNELNKLHLLKRLKKGKGVLNELGLIPLIYKGKFKLFY